MVIGQEYNPYMMFTGSFIPNYIMMRKDLTSTDKLLFARLSQYSGKNGECYPSQETLADEVGCSVSAIKLSIKHLVEFKLIKVIKPQGAERLMHLHDRYVFIWSEMFEDCSTVKNKLSDKSESDSPIKENHIKENHKEKDKTVKSEKHDSTELPIKPSLFHSVKNKPRDTYAEQILCTFLKEHNKRFPNKHKIISDDKMTECLYKLNTLVDLIEDDFEEKLDYIITEFFNKRFRDRNCDYSLILFTDCFEAFANRARGELY